MIYLPAYTKEKMRNLVSFVRPFIGISRTRSFFSHSRCYVSENNNTISIGGSNIHYEKAGSGKSVLLMLPGAMGSGRTHFAQQLALLNRDLVTMVAIDPPGYGQSAPRRTWPADWYERDANCAHQVMKTLGFDKYNVVGIGDGGFSAVLLASEIAKGSIQKLIISSTPGYMTEKEVGTLRKITDLSNWSVRTKQRYLQEYDEIQLQELQRKWIHAVAGYFAQNKVEEFKKRLVNITCPTLIIQGDQDIVTPKNYAEFYNTYIKGSRDVGVLTLRTGLHERLSMASSKLSSHLAVNGCDIHYEQAGRGKNVVFLLPGAIGSARTDFRLQLSNMHRDVLTLVAWDPPGYGKSTPQRTWPDHWFMRDAECAAQMMKTMGHQKYNVLGWSDGGITGLILAAIAPENVEKLVVWGSNAYVTKEEVESYQKISDISNWSAQMKQPFIEEYGEGRFQELWKEWIDAVTQYYTGERQGNFCKGLLKDIKCPTLIIHGQKDALVPQFHPDYLHANIANSRLVNMPDGKHNLHMRFYKEFNSMVENFIMEPLSYSNL